MADASELKSHINSDGRTSETHQNPLVVTSDSESSWTAAQDITKNFNSAISGT